MDSSFGASAARTGELESVPSAPRTRIDAHVLRIRKTGRRRRRIAVSSLKPTRFLVQSHSRGAFHVPAETVRNDFNQTDLGWRDVGDLAVGLAEVVTHRDTMHEPVLRTNESVYSASSF